MEDRSARDGSESGDAMVGRYRLVEQLGEGGFGVVWLAEQREPVVRQVALKVIKLGMDTKQVLARFDAERQALALMEHQNIAKVYDGGTTDQGRPYFVMELVRGVPITRYCDEQRCSTRERLEFFVQVCQAVQHAHQKGVIHRDIKPSNVLMGEHDGVAVPKVIDFGIAKATNVRLTEQTMFTETRQIIGTPEYMAPEQAEFGGRDVDTRADVYSLGVLLYEIVTGTKPFELREIVESGYDEVLRTIREVDPPKPSTRISTLGEGLAQVADRRRAEPRQLGRLVRGDLDWIVMRAIEKDRARRYQSAGELSEDIGRYLRDEPVLATPPSTIYRVKKYVRRHKVVVGATAAIFVALIAGLVAALSGRREALHQTRIALQQGELASARAREAQEQQQIAEGARAAEQAERERAELGEANARASEARAKAVADLLQSALTAADPYGEKGKDYTVRELLDGIDREVGLRLTEDPESELALRTTLGASYRGLGVYDKAEEHLARAAALARETRDGDHATLATLLANLAYVVSTRGRLDEARVTALEALEMQRRLGARSEQVTTMTVLASIERERGQHAAAEQFMLEARALIDELGGEHTDLDLVDAGIAVSMVQRGDYVAAEPLLREVVERMRREHAADHPDLALALTNAGITYLNLGKLDEAEQVLRESLAMMRRLYDGPHLDLATCLNNLGTALVERGQLDEAAVAFTEGLETMRALEIEDDAMEAHIANNLGAIAWERGDHAKAAACAEDALEVYLRRHPPDDPAAILMRNNALKAYVRSNQPKPVESLARAQLEACRNVYGPGDDETLTAAGQLFDSLCVTAWDERDGDRAEEAEAVARELLAQVEAKRGETHVETLEARCGLGRALVTRVRASAAETRSTDALLEASELLERCFEAATELESVRRGSARWSARLHVVWHEIDPGRGSEALAQEWRARYEALGGKTP